ncbi:hypothetical protein MRB53_036398 [Persea americana]|nr:hypothetical protein MRB53_036398 [Persea americana]
MAWLSLWRYRGGYLRGHVFEWGMALSTFHGSSVVLAPSPVLGFSLTCSETFSRALFKLVASLIDKHFQGFACLLYSPDPQGRAEHEWRLGDRLLLSPPAGCSRYAHAPSRKEAIATPGKA